MMIPFPLKLLPVGLAALSLAFSSCDSSEKKPSTNKNTPVSVKSESTTLSKEFLSLLPHDTNVLGVIYNPHELWQKLNNSQTFKFFSPEQKKTSLFSTNDLIQTLLTTAGTEAIFAQYGDVELFLNSYKEFKKEATRLAEAKETSTTGAGDYKADIKRALLQTIEIPPTFLAFKNGEDSYKLLKTTFDTYFSTLPAWQSYLTPLEYKTNGSTFQGYKINLKNAVDAIKTTGSRDNTTPSEKNLVILLARQGDYSIFYLGSDASDIRFAPTHALSLRGSDELAFLADYKKETTSSIIYLSPSIITPLFRDNFNSLAEENKEVVTDLQELIDEGFIKDDDSSVMNALLALLEKEKEHNDFYTTSTSAFKMIVQNNEKELSTDLFLSRELVARFLNLEYDLKFPSLALLPETDFVAEIYISSEDKKNIHEESLFVVDLIKKLLDSFVASDYTSKELTSIPALYEQARTPLFNTLDTLVEIFPTLKMNNGIFSQTSTDSTSTTISAFFSLEDSNAFKQISVKGIQSFNAILPIIQLNSHGDEQSGSTTYELSFDNDPLSKAVLHEDSGLLSFSSAPTTQFIEPNIAAIQGKDRPKGAFLYINIPRTLTQMDHWLFESDDHYAFFIRESFGIDQPLSKKFPTEIKTLTINTLPQEEEVKINLRFTY